MASLDYHCSLIYSLIELLSFNCDHFQELEELTASYKYKSEKLEDCEKALEELGGHLSVYVTSSCYIEFSTVIVHSIYNGKSVTVPGRN